MKTTKKYINIRENDELQKKRRYGILLLQKQYITEFNYMEEKTMKKLLCMLLVAITLVSAFSVAVMADTAEVNIVIDGVKDEAYIDEMSIPYDYWLYWADASNTTEPVDPERVKNTLWFRWDDNFVYLYFEAVSKDPLYQPAPGEAKPDRGMTWYEQVNIYLDTAPSAEYLTPCTQGDKDENGDPALCNHFCCNANDGEGKYYRVMGRYSAAWDQWHNYYRSDEGMFLTYEEFCAKRGGEKGYEDLEAMYAKENGAGEVKGFINYETYTYGFEMKYPRVTDEEYFQVNIVNDVPEYDWPEDGPELGYSMSFCKAPWTNSAELMEIYFEDYENLDVPAQVNAVKRMREELPSIDSIGLEHKNAVLSLNHEYTQLTDAHKAIAEREVPGLAEFLTAAVTKVNTLQYVANLGDVNTDGAITANDALVALRATVGKIQLDDDRVARADVNGDGKVDAKDALEMLQFTVGNRKEFSVVRTLDI